MTTTPMPTTPAPTTTAAPTTPAPTTTAAPTTTPAPTTTAAPSVPVGKEYDFGNGPGGRSSVLDVAASNKLGKIVAYIADYPAQP